MLFCHFSEEKLEKFDKHSALTTAPATSSAGAFDLPPTPDVEMTHRTRCKPVIHSVSFSPTMGVEQKIILVL